MNQSLVYEFLSTKDCDIIITKDDKSSSLVHEVAKFLNKKSIILPDFRAKYGEDLRSYNAEMKHLLQSLNSYFYDNQNENKILISPIRTLLNNLPTKEFFQRKTLHFAQKINLEELKGELYYWGYSFVDIVEEKAEVSFRGDIIDIFLLDKEYPFRISLFDNEIESIRKFDNQTQRSINEELEQIQITPALYSLSKSEYEKVEEKINLISSDAFYKDLHSLGFWALQENFSDFLQKKCYFCENFDSEIDELKSFYEDYDFNKLNKVQLMPLAKNYKDILVGEIHDFLSLNQHKKINILARNEAIIKQADILKYKFNFIKSSSYINIASNKEVIISLNKLSAKRRKNKASIILDELKVNDYIVHENYGIGIFQGLINTTVLGIKKDFVSLLYKNNDKVLLPVENLNVIDRYIASSEAVVSLDQLGKTTFFKLKQKVKEKLFVIANELIKEFAKRQIAKAKKINTDLMEIKQLQINLGFEYTKDQLNSIHDIFDEFESGNIMDRLLSGDVGFGKTEIALNALLCIAKNNYQGLFLAPTTLLSSQHYNTLKQRLKEFDVKIAKLDRYVSTKEKKQILDALKKGDIDICVGTHTLLGVEVKNLALVVIDEEHKFGVKQKEMIKALKEDTHILSMSATPIPRSLNKALSKIKTYSTLTTPPLDREDVRTFLKNYDDNLVKEVIKRELKRGGQVFYIHNKIATILQKAKELREIISDLKIAILHSQINAKESEKIMLEFSEKKYDLLLSTSIVESGIHLPNANTIIIENANHFGMADLHQLRGRVGRGKQRGYCYFLIFDELKDKAKKRLLALEDNSFLGSGAVLAYHDLQIRGGGNLVGEAQSGHIKNIGYTLYLKMLENALNLLLKQEEPTHQVDLKLNVNAYISEFVVSEDRLRLELYRRLSKCQEVKEVLEIESEIYDRFKDIDKPTKYFLELINIKILSKVKKIKLISNYEEKISIKYHDDKVFVIKARSKDDDDIIYTILEFLRTKENK